MTTVGGGRRFLVTTGLGETHEFDAETLAYVHQPERVAGVRWDNHAVAALKV